MSQHLMSFAQAAASLGWSGSKRARGLRLMRLVMAREREIGRRIATRIPNASRTNYRVTLSVLRRHLPSLFKSKVDELGENMRGYLAAIDEKIAEAAAEHVSEYVEPRLQELWDRDEHLAERVNDLGLRVKLLADRLPTQARRSTPKHTA
jgi:hypothetical protein